MSLETWKREEEKRNDKECCHFLCLISMADNNWAETHSIDPHICNLPNLGGFESRQWSLKN